MRFENQTCTLRPKRWSRIAVATLTVWATFFGACYAQDDSGRVRPQVLKAAVQILTPAAQDGLQKTGTGFLVSKEMSENGQARRVIFLATNKHMLGDWNEIDRNILTYYDWIEVWLYLNAPNAAQRYKPVTIKLKDENLHLRTGKVFLHPSPEIDVALVSIDEELLGVTDLDLESCDVSYLIPFNSIPNF
jgi:hypothetical protein